MANIAIVGAAHEARLGAVVASAGLTLIYGTARQFTGLETCSIPLL